MPQKPKMSVPGWRLMAGGSELIIPLPSGHTLQLREYTWVDPHLAVATTGATAEEATAETGTVPRHPVTGLAPAVVAATITIVGMTGGTGATTEATTGMTGLNTMTAMIDTTVLTISTIATIGPDLAPILHEDTSIDDCTPDKTARLLQKGCRCSILDGAVQTAGSREHFDRYTVTNSQSHLSC